MLIFSYQNAFKKSMAQKPTPRVKIDLSIKMERKVFKSKAATNKEGPKSSCVPNST